MEIKRGKTIIDGKRIFPLFLSTLPEAFILIDDKGIVTHWNPASEKLFGFSAKEAIGKDLRQLIVPTHFHENYKRGFERFRSSGREVIKRGMELVAMKKDGTEFPVEISLSTVKIKGLWYALALVRDITERKKAERRIYDTNRLLKMFAQDITIKEFLDTAVKLIKDHCGCRHTGVRLLNRKGYIPFESYDGYSEDFIACESPISIYNDQCVCIRAITSKPDPQDTDIITPNGSFCYHDFIEYMSKLDPKTMSRYRGACALYGFRSVAVIPVNYNEKMVGLIHLADERIGIFSQDLVEFMETLSYIIGEAIAKFNAQEELARLASAAESAADAIVVTDNRGVVQYANPAFEQITGYTKDEVIGRNLHILDSGAHGEDFYIKIRETLKNEGKWKGELINKKKDGTIYHEECTISAVKDTSGKIINYVAIKRDVTEKIRLESIAQAVNAMNNIGYVFSGIRHEIGNPVNSIKMTLTMLKENLKKIDISVINEYLGRSIDEIRRIEYLLKTFKTFNMYEHMEIQNISIRFFMDKFFTIIKDDFFKRGISVSLHIKPDVDYCYADPRALHQVLLNILINACDAFDGKKDPNISITVSNSSGMINIKVQDNACGMTEEQLKNLFRPFYTTKPNGTGLGLVIAKRMLSLMDGTIEIESIKDKGTIVSIFLPRGANAL